MTKLDFTNQFALQDMIYLIMQEKNLSIKEAIKFAIKKELLFRIQETDWAEIAIQHWGHDNPERKWNSLRKPIIEIEFSEDERKTLDYLIKRYQIDLEMALGYFLVFTMESLGYHI